MWLLKDGFFPLFRKLVEDCSGTVAIPGGGEQFPWSHHFSDNKAPFPLELVWVLTSQLQSLLSSPSPLPVSPRSHRIPKSQVSVETASMKTIKDPAASASPVLRLKVCHHCPAANDSLNLKRKKSHSLCSFQENNFQSFLFNDPGLFLTIADSSAPPTRTTESPFKIWNKWPE